MYEYANRIIDFLENENLHVECRKSSTEIRVEDLF